jgi:hypothetical protein
MHVGSMNWKHKIIGSTYTSDMHAGSMNWKHKVIGSTYTSEMHVGSMKCINIEKA